MAPPDLLERRLMPQLLEALSDTPVVLLNGSRQAGKSTLASQHAAAALLAGRMDLLTLLPFTGCACCAAATRRRCSDALLSRDDRASLTRQPHAIWASWSSFFWCVAYRPGGSIPWRYW